MERMPSQHLDTEARFMDYIGNPLNGALGAFDTLQEKGLSPERTEWMMNNLLVSWKSIFARLEIFKNTEFQPLGNITHENLEALLAFKDKDPLQDGVLEEFDALYHSVVDK